MNLSGNIFGVQYSFVLGKKDEVINSSNIRQMAQGKGNTFNKDQAEKISAVFSCIKILSETLSRMPVSIYQETDGGIKEDKNDYRYDLLNLQPNNYTTNQVFFSTLEVHRNKTGNAFARIIRDKKTYRPIRLEILHPSKVNAIKYINGEMYYLLYNEKYKHNFEPINSNDILHFRTISDDGVWGISPIEVLNPNLSVTSKALQTIDNLYENDAISTKILQPEHNVSEEKLNEALMAYEKANTGSSNAGKIIKVPPYMRLENIDINLQDKEFVDTIKYNSRQIASVFGVPPHLVGEYEASKFNNVEQLQLHFKVNTISAIKEIYKRELEYKLLTTKERKEGKSIDFDLNKLVESDETTKMDRDTKAINFGMLTPNEVNRRRGWPTYEEGEQHYMNTSMQAVEYYNEKQQTDINKKKQELKLLSKQTEKPNGKK